MLSPSKQRAPRTPLNLETFVAALFGFSAGFALVATLVVHGWL